MNITAKLTELNLADFPFAKAVMFMRSDDLNSIISELRNDDSAEAAENLAICLDEMTERAND